MQEREADSLIDAFLLSKLLVSQSSPKESIPENRKFLVKELNIIKLRVKTVKAPVVYLRHRMAFVT